MLYKRWEVNLSWNVREPSDFLWEEFAIPRRIRRVSNRLNSNYSWKQVIFRTTLWYYTAKNSWICLKSPLMTERARIRDSCVWISKTQFSGRVEESIRIVCSTKIRSTQAIEVMTSSHITFKLYTWIKYKLLKFTLISNYISICEADQYQYQDGDKRKL